jgi:hypothetical protein
MSTSTRISNRSTASISDVEDDRYRKIAKKLAKDRSELKDKLRRLISDIEGKNKEHKTELQKTQAYYQEQLSELTDERNKAYNTVEKLREALTDEKETIREQYEQKYNKQKELLEKKYQARDTQPLIKKLEDKIATLQEKLDQKNQEGPDEFYVQREAHYKKTINDLETVLQKMQKRDSEITMESKLAVHNAVKEKDEELSKIRFEKDNTVLALKTTIEKLERRVREAERERDETVALSKQQMDNFKKTQDRLLTDNLENMNKNIEIVRRELQSKLDSEKHNHNAELEKTRKDNETIIANLKAEYTKNIDILSDNLNRKLQNREKDYQELKLKTDKQIGETEELNFRLKEQLSQLKENQRKYQDSTQTMNTQFINNLNKQKELADIEITARDKAINHLEWQLKKLGEESIERINNMDNKIRSLSDELRESFDKYNTLKFTHEKLNYESSLWKTELSKIREAYEKLSEANKMLTTTKDDLDKRVQTLELEKQVKMNDYNKNDEELKILRTICQKVSETNKELQSAKDIAEKKVTELENDLRNNEALVNKAIEDSKMLPHAIVKLNKEKTNLQSALTNIENKFNLLQVDFQTVQNNLNTRTQQLREAQEHNLKYDGRIIQLQKERDTLQKQVNTAEEKLNQLQVEFANAGAMLTSQTQVLKDRYADLKKDEEVLRERLLQSEKNELLAREAKKELEDAKTEINRLKANFVTTLNNISKESALKEEEIQALKKQCQGMINKDSQILELMTKLNDVNISRAKIEEQHLNELSQLNRKLHDSETRLLNTNQQIDGIKADFAKQLDIMRGVHEREVEKQRDIERRNEEAKNKEKQDRENDARRIRELEKVREEERAKAEEQFRKNRDRELELQQQLFVLAEESKKKQVEIERRSAEDLRTKEELFKKAMEDLKKKEEEAKKLAEEVRRKEEEVTYKEEQQRKKQRELASTEEELKRKVEEAKKIEEERYKKLREEQTRLEEEKNRYEQDLKKKEEEAKKKTEANFKKIVDDAKREIDAKKSKHEEDLKKKEEELKKREEELHQKLTDENRRKEEELRNMLYSIQKEIEGKDLEINQDIVESAPKKLTNFFKKIEEDM